MKFVHVAGSNGKGSVCSMLASILTEAGYRVGLFTSPHIKDFTERIRINGKQIDQNSVVDFIQKIRTTDLEFDPSFFEVTFVLALEYFKKENCDICILETGLGGRLDSTNIIVPELSVITNISLEHTQLLGDSIEEIAEEKGGIIKEGVPVIFGNMDKKAEEVLMEIAEAKNAKRFSSENEYEFKSPLLGEHQQENLSTVISACTCLQKKGYFISNESIRKGLDHLIQNSGFIGRMQIVSEQPIVIFDVSHNPDGIQKTMEAIKHLPFNKLHIVYGTSADKDAKTVARLFPHESIFYFTEFSNERSMKTKELSELDSKARLFNSADDALQAAKDNANLDDLILVTGSFFLLADLEF